MPPVRPQEQASGCLGWPACLKKPAVLRADGFLPCFLPLFLSVPTSPKWALCHPSSSHPRRADLFRETWKPFDKRKREPLLACRWSHITFSV